MKTALLVSLAFGVGLAGTSGAVYALRDKTVQPPAADSTAAVVPDSSAHGAAAVKPTAPAAPPESARAVAAPALPSAPMLDSVLAPPKTRDSLVLPPAPKALEPDYPRLAKILTAMPALSSTELMARLSDKDAEGILRSLGQRQAAALLAGLPKDRAALLGQRLLVKVDSKGAP